MNQNPSTEPGPDLSWSGVSLQKLKHGTKAPDGKEEQFIEIIIIIIINRLLSSISNTTLTNIKIILLGVLEQLWH